MTNTVSPSSSPDHLHHERKGHERKALVEKDIFHLHTKLSLRTVCSYFGGVKVVVLCRCARRIRRVGE